MVCKPPGKIIIIADNSGNPLDVMNEYTSLDVIYSILKNLDKKFPECVPHVAWFAIEGKGWIRWV